MKLGADGYLIKPPEPQAILRFLDNSASDASSEVKTNLTVNGHLERAAAFALLLQ